MNRFPLRITVALLALAAWTQTSADVRHGHGDHHRGAQHGGRIYYHGLPVTHAYRHHGRHHEYRYYSRHAHRHHGHLAPYDGRYRISHYRGCPHDWYSHDYALGYGAGINLRVDDFWLEWREAY